MFLSREKVFPFPTNSPNCYEDTRLRSADLKINHETRVLLLMISACATPASDSSLCLILTCCCETVPTVPVVSAHHQYQDNTYTYHLVNAFPVQQEISVLNKRILSMRCCLSSNLSQWPGICFMVATSTSEILTLYSGTDDVLIFLMRNSISYISYCGMFLQATMDSFQGLPSDNLIETHPCSYDPLFSDATPLKPVPQK